VNTGDLKAILRTIRLVVEDAHPCDTLRLARPGAPVTLHHHTVTLTPETKELDIRGRACGAPVEPGAFPPAEVESFLVDLSSTHGYDYRCHLVADWYAVRQPGVARQSRSPTFTVEFAPEPAEMLARDGVATAPPAVTSLEPAAAGTVRHDARATPITILFLAANPSNTTRLALQKEAQVIDNRLHATALRDRFRVEQQWEVRAAECVLLGGPGGVDRPARGCRDRHAAGHSRRRCHQPRGCLLRRAGPWQGRLHRLRAARLGIEFGRSPLAGIVHRDFMPEHEPGASDAGSGPRLHVRTGVDPKQLFVTMPV
jgi:hypothetical protein